MSRVCLLTGASGPLGAAFIERHAGRYHIVAVRHRRPAYVASQHQRFIDPLAPNRDLAANAHRAHTISADLTRPEEIDALVEEALQAYGKIDLLVNAAGVRRFSPLLADCMQAGAAELLNVNVLAPLGVSLALARASWRAQRDANVEANRNIVNISSTAGLYVYPDYGQALYATSKAAINHLTYHLASEFWDIGIRVNAVAPDTFPGRIPTEVVLDAIDELDRSSETGQVRVLQMPEPVIANRA